MTFGEKLADQRRRLGLSQEQLADRLGVTRQSVSKWESGAAMPEVAKLVALADLFGVTVDYLVRDDAVETAAPAGTPEDEARRFRRAFDQGLSIYSYTSRRKLFGLPLLSVRFSHARWPCRSSTAVGILAVGNFAVGVVSVGLISAGLFSVGIIALGLLLALGAVSLGGVALGATALGLYAFGASAVGLKLAVGAAAAGGVAVGVDAEGARTLLLAGQTAESAAQFLTACGVWRPARALAAALLRLFL